MDRFTERFGEENALIIGISKVFNPIIGTFYCGEAVDKLAEYEDLEEQKRLIRLPVAVGDTVYVINKNSYGVFVDEGEVLEVSNQGIWAEDACFDYNDFGKTIFLTEQEAEAKLREMESAK